MAALLNRTLEAVQGRGPKVEAGRSDNGASAKIQVRDDGGLHQDCVAKVERGSPVLGKTYRWHQEDVLM